MYQQDMAILRSLAVVAWSDGDFAAAERQVLDGILDAYGANDSEKADLRAFASTPKTLDHIDLQELSAADRRVVLQQAVLITYANKTPSAAQISFIDQLGSRLRIPTEEAESLVSMARERALKLQHLL
jgi:uncharacterized membrane protein YebE (DUF533 family)